MKKLLLIMVALTVLIPGLCFGFDNFENGIGSYGIPVLGAGNGIPTTTGNYWFVDSGIGSNGYDGKSPTHPFATIDYAIGKCTASNGDIIVVAPGHSEAISAAAGINLDVAGVTVVGLGEGRKRPEITYSTSTAATLAVGAADCVLKNVVVDMTGKDAVIQGIDVNAAGFQLLNCEVITADATGQVLTAVTADENADRLKILGCRFYGTSDTGSSAAIGIFAQEGVVADDVEIGYCTFESDYSSAAIWCDGVATQVNLHDLVIWNENNGDHGIEITAAATGSARNIDIRTDAYATAMDPGSLDLFHVMWDADGTPDKTAIEVLPRGDGAASWNAEELAAIQSEGNDGLVALNLDHIAKTAISDTSDPVDMNTEITSQTILANMLSITGDPTDFDRRYDSLEALGDDTDTIITAVNKIPLSDGTNSWNATALTAIEGEAEDALEGENLDHFIKTAVDTSLTTTVALNSTLDYILNKNSTREFDRDTDSLQAIAEGSALTPFNLDHLVQAAYDTNFQTTVASNSVVGCLASKSASSSFDRTKASLEALGEIKELTAVATAKDLTAHGATTIFTVAGGPVEILSLVGTFTTACSATAQNYTLLANPTNGADTPLCTAVDINAAAQYSWSYITGAVGSAMVIAVPGTALPLGIDKDTPVVVPVGVIQMSVDDDNGLSLSTGDITWYIRVRPLSTGVTITGS